MVRNIPPSSDRQFVKIGEAAELLGVSTPTLRAWDRAGKLKAVRNPKNGYRLYDRRSLDALRKSDTSPTTTASSRNPGSAPERAKPTNGRAARGLINQISRILRDTDGSSDLLGRFDEISKLWLLHSIATADVNSCDLYRKPKETEPQHGGRIKRAYAAAVKESGAFVPKRFRTIKASDRAIGQVMGAIRDFLSEREIDSLGLAYEEIVGRTFDKTENQQFFTPPQVVDFVTSIASEEPVGHVCDPAAGSGGFLVDIVKDGLPYNTVTGFEIDERLAWVASINLLTHGLPQDVFALNCFPHHGALGEDVRHYFTQFDTIVTNPPFGSDVGDRTLLKSYTLGAGRVSRRRGILFLERAASFLREGGRLISVVDEGILSLPNSSDVRQFLRSNFEIEAIVALPDTAFMPYANVNTSVIVLRRTDTPNHKKRTFMAKAFRVGRRANGDDDITYDDTGKITVESDLPEVIQAWRNFCAGRDPSESYRHAYAVNFAADAPDPAERLDVLSLEPHRRHLIKRLEELGGSCISLGELCEERTIQVAPAQDLEGELIPYTGLADIEAITGKYKRQIIPAVSLKSNVKRYEAGDILYARMRPNLRKVAYVGSGEGGYVSPECVVLRVRENSEGIPLIQPSLLASLMRSDLVYTQVEGRVAGIGRPRISSSDLLKTLIPIPSEGVLREAVRLHFADVEAEAALREEMQKTEQRLSDQVRQTTARLADLLLGEDNLDELAPDRRCALGLENPQVTTDWLERRIQDHIYDAVVRERSMRRIAVPAGQAIPLDSRVISSVRSRVSLHLENVFGELLEEAIHLRGLNEVIVGTVPENTYPDFQLCFPDDYTGLRFEVKAVECLADEAAANFGTLLGEIREDTDFLAVLVWEWDSSPWDTERRRTPRVLDVRFFHARSVALLRDNYWLQHPDPRKGDEGFQGIDSLRAWTGTRKEIKPEEKNLGKVTRLYGLEDTPECMVRNKLTTHTCGQYNNFKRWIEQERFVQLQNNFLPAAAAVLGEGVGAATPLSDETLPGARCGTVALIQGTKLTAKQVSSIASKHKLQELFILTPRGKITHYSASKGGDVRKNVGTLHQDDKGVIKALDFIPYCFSFGE